MTDLHYVQGKPLFTHTAYKAKQYPYLTADKETEVVIIGGGVTGSIVAYTMTMQGIPCILLEKKRIAHGSTSVTTSLLQYELDSNAVELEAFESRASVIQAYQLGMRALKTLEAFMHTHGNHCDYEKKDTLLYSNKQSDEKMLREEYNVRQQAGLAVNYLDDTQTLFDFPMVAGVYGVGGGAQLDPYRYTHHLLEVSTESGLQVYENTEVSKLTYTEEGVVVHAAYDYTIKAKKVVLATGYDTDSFTKRAFGQKTMTYNIATKPLEVIKGWANKALIRDNEEPYHYYRTTQDGRLLAGGEDIPFEQGVDNEQKAQESYKRLEARLKTLFPAMKDAITIDYAYGGAFASTKDDLGFVGPDPTHEHLWYCLGYGANGILFALLGAEMLTKLYQGTVDEAMQVFRVDRFDGKGGKGC